MNVPQFSFIKNSLFFVFHVLCFFFEFLVLIFLVFLFIDSCFIMLFVFIRPSSLCSLFWLGAFHFAFLVVAIHWHSSSCFLCWSNILHHILFVATTNKHFSLCSFCWPSFFFYALLIVATSDTLPCAFCVGWALLIMFFVIL